MRSILLGLVAILALCSSAQTQSLPSQLAPYANPLSQFLESHGPNATGYDWFERQYVGAVMDYIATPPDAIVLHPLLHPDLGVFLSRFHKFRARTGIRHLRDNPAPATGVRLYKFYSSGWVVKGPGFAFAVDFDDGPFEPDPLYSPFLVPLPDVDIEILADSIDAYFVTHRHADHISPRLIIAMAERNKPTFVTQDVADIAMIQNLPFAGSLIVPVDGVETLIGSMTFVTYAGYQVFGNQLIPNNCYMFNLNNTVVAHFGDNDDPGVLTFAQNCFSTGWDVDVTLNIGGSEGALDALWAPPLKMDSHQWEFAHIGSAFQTMNIGAAPNSMGRSLFWGEFLDVNP